MFYYSCRSMNRFCEKKRNFYLHNSKKSRNFAAEMKSTKEYISLLQQHAHVLREKYGVTSLSLFGSVARGEQQEGSDVDVLVEMPPSLRAVGGANIYLENILGCHVDMIRNHKRLTPFFRKQIERDAVTIF